MEAFRLPPIVRTPLETGCHFPPQISNVCVGRAGEVGVPCSLMSQGRLRGRVRSPGVQGRRPAAWGLGRAALPGPVLHQLGWLGSPLS